LLNSCHKKHITKEQILERKLPKHFNKEKKLFLPPPTLSDLRFQVESIEATN
jgi:hypothetical protein